MAHNKLRVLSDDVALYNELLSALTSGRDAHQAVAVFNCEEPLIVLICEVDSLGVLLLIVHVKDDPHGIQLSVQL